jgi:hypothetical protein
MVNGGAAFVKVNGRLRAKGKGLSALPYFDK